MNVFGPPETDPLLQDDPFPPLSDNQSSADADPPGPSRPKPENEAAASSKLLLGSMADAQEGNLSALNRALANGWILERVEFRPAKTLAIVLRRPPSEAETSEQGIYTDSPATTD